MAYILGSDIAFVEIPKNFSTSVVSCICKQDAKFSADPHITLDQYKKKYPLIRCGVSLLRSPEDRFFSACNFIIDGKPASKLREILEDFQNCIKSGVVKKEYIFLYPQYSFLMSDVPVHLYTIESCAAMLTQINAKPDLPHLNSSRKRISREVADKFFRTDFFQDLYSVDVFIWGMIESSNTRSLSIESPRDFFAQIRGYHEN